MGNFREVLSDCHLSDLGYNGAHFTFSNKRKGQYESKARLDRLVATPDWKLAFPNARILHLTATYSDHTRILTDMHHFHRARRVKKPFRFEPMWFRHEEFKDYVSNTWHALSTQEFNLNNKLLNLGSSLLNWNSKSFGDVNCRIKELKTELETLRSLHRDDNTASIELSISNEIDKWLFREEIL